MTIKELQNKITELKNAVNAVILAHSYQSREIVEIADYTGDSFQLSVWARDAGADNIILCGVRFMAETAKILNPEKRVYLPNPLAGCPMAEQFSPDEIRQLKKREPDRAVVAYINTTAELKKLCDVCVTSSSAVRIIERMEAEKILFIPDANLGDYVKKRVSNKDIMLIRGGCPVHAAATLEDLREAKALRPDALALVHPECDPAVVEAADYVGSTSGIAEFAKNSPNREFIIGTEISVREHLQYDCPEKSFYILSKKISCPNMRLTTLADVLGALNAVKDGGGGFETKMDKHDILAARKCIDEMLRLNG
ncbi:MAG: quinolinate synthase NadA [Oscillospiraceae bacterium]|jgi:quinolinate synthase|nr:quinolinate synthase NadA [Oscillospiraceae bacterium]